MARSKKTIYSLLAMLAVIAIVLSVCFVAVEADHNCTGAHCAICHQISACESLLRSFGLPGAAAGIMAAVGYTIFHCLGYRKEAARIATPVSLKVKLSD